MKSGFKFLQIVCVFGVWGTGVAFASEPLMLKIKSYNRIFEGDRISLLDVVEREGLKGEVEKKLSTIHLGDAPNVGEERVYTNKALADAIRRSGIKKQWGLQIPRQIVIENKGYDLNRDSVESELLANWRTLCSDCQLKVKSLQLPALAKELAHQPWSIENDGKLPRGSFAVRMLVKSDSGRSNVLWINGQLEVRMKVPVLTRAVAMNTRFNEADLTMELRDVTFATDTTPTASEVVGQRARFSMNANDIIWRGSILREKAVQRGQLVKVSVGDENWQVSLQAVTEQDGFVGDTISLRNPQTNRLLTGKVVASGEVEIR